MFRAPFLYTALSVLGCLSSTTSAVQQCTAAPSTTLPSGYRCNFQADVPSGYGWGFTSLSSSNDPAGDCSILCHNGPKCKSFGVTNDADKRCILYGRAIKNLPLTHNQDNASFYHKKCYDYTCDDPDPHDCPNVLSNGDFSNGLTDWTTNNTATEVYADSGSAFFDAAPSKTYAISQTFDFPCPQNHIAVTMDYFLHSLSPGSNSQLIFYFNQGNQYLGRFDVSFFFNDADDTSGNPKGQWNTATSDIIYLYDQSPIRMDVWFILQSFTGTSQLSLDNIKLSTPN